MTRHVTGPGRRELKRRLASWEDAGREEHLSGDTLCSEKVRWLTLAYQHKCYQTEKTFFHLPASPFFFPFK